MSDNITPDSTAESSTGIRRSSSRAARSSKPKKNQLPFAFGLLVLIIAAGIMLNYLVSERTALFWFTGLAFGIILQKSRFCFTASMRDPYLTGVTSVTKSVLTAIAITSLGFWAIKYGAHLRGLPIPGQSFVVPISFATAAGGIMFGTGMVIAGGCASGTLMRVGEGFFMQIISLFFFIAGSLWAAHDYGWWTLNFIMKGKTVFLPDVFGWFGALSVQLLLVACIWIAADKWSKFRGAADNH